MSTRIMSACWPLSMSSTQKSVLISLADQANDQGVCWPSVGSIAERTCLSERAVRKAIRDLEELGYVQSNVRSGTSSYYTVTPAQGSAPEGRSAPASHAGGAAPDAGEGGTPCRGPRHQLPPNRKEPSLNPKEPSKGRKKFKPEDHTPEPLDPETWAAFCQFRRDLKKPIRTDKAVNLIAKDFARHGLTTEQAQACVEHSMKNEYQGLFPEKFASWKPAQPQSFTETDYSKGVTADGRLA